MTLRTAGSVAIGVLLGAAIGAHAEETWRFDPSRCKTGAADKLYIAFGRNVLAITATSNPPIGVSLIPLADDRPLTPPEPSEPRGCFGNPRQLRDFGTPGYLMLWTPPSVEGQRLGEASQLELARYLCDHTPIHEELPEGATACRAKMRDDPDPDHWGVTFMAHDYFYKTPLGHPFVVNCGPGRGPQCDVSYTYRPGLNLSFRYLLLNHTGPVTIGEIIARDRAARDRIAADLVPDYSWPDPAEVP